MTSRIALLVCFSFSLVACGAEPTYFAETIRILDGDTIEVLTEERKTVRIRLNAIDAPETKQPFSAKSKEALGGMTFRKTVRVVPTGRDRYRRTLADIYIGETRINAVMIAKGFAWHYAQYNDESELADFQRIAKDKKLGLWSLPDPVAPWGLAKATQIGKETKMTKRVPQHSDIQNACPSIITCEIVRHGPF